MSNYEIVIKYTKAIEGKLEEFFDAEGRGLTEKVRSIEGQIPDDCVKKIKYLAHIRNRVVHQDGFEIENIDKFKFISEDVLEELEAFAVFGKKTKSTNITDENKNYKNEEIKSSSTNFLQKKNKIRLLYFTILNLFLLPITLPHFAMIGYIQRGVGGAVLFGSIALIVCLFITKAISIFLTYLTIGFKLTFDLIIKTLKSSYHYFIFILNKLVFYLRKPVVILLLVIIFVVLFWNVSL